MSITNMEITQATIEIFGGFICLMLAVIIMMNGHERSSWKSLKRMLFAISLIFFSEACAYIFRGDTGKINIFITRISNFFLFFMNIVLVVFFINYMYHLLREKGVEPGKLYKNIVYICVVISFLILVTNLFTKWMYFFDDANLYHRNTGWYVYTILNLLCILTSSAMSIRYRRSLSKTMFAALLFYAFAPIIAIVLQTLIYGISITNIGIFIAMIVMLLAYLKEWSRVKDETDRKSMEIIILFVIMIVSMSASVVSCIISIKRLSNKISEGNSMLIAHMISDSIENEFLKPIVVSETMSNDYSLKQYMKKSGEISPQNVEEEVAAYLESICTGFGYQMVFAVCDASKAYYTCNGITKYIDVEKNEHDIWYKLFLEQRERGNSYDLDVDTDETNHWELSVFVNVEIIDENGKLLGVCGVGVEMTELQKLLKHYEDSYNVKINLIDREGLIQVDSDAERIERDYLDNSYLQIVDSKEFTYEQRTENSRMTKYMEDLDWYLIVEDNNPEKINVMEIILSSIIIFVIGLMMMVIVFCVVYIRERKSTSELQERRKLSITDDMTGLFNRRAYDEDCLKLIEADLVSEITMIMMDLNGLKAVNDTYGHATGDELIIGAAKCMRTAMCELGKVYRIGGDEFVALLRCDEPELQDMLKTFEHLLDIWNDNHKNELAISKGIVVAQNYPDFTFDEINELADKRMYEEKEEYYRHTGKKRRKM